MILYNKVRAVEKIFHELDKNINIFQSHSGLHCLAGCGHCCLNPEIEATILEFLPFAYHYYKSGKAHEIYEALEKNATRICQLLAPVKPSSATGFCSEYKYRGLICRLFGFSARRNKYNNLEMFTCKIIKENQANEYILTTEKINGTYQIPVVSDYYMQLRMIDAELGGITLPINEAIRKAFDLIINYYHYRNLPGDKYRKIS